MFSSVWGALKGLFGSKKFWVAMVVAPVVLSALAVVLPSVGVSPEMVHTILEWVAGIMGVSAAGYGLQDFGKERAKLESGK